MQAVVYSRAASSRCSCKLSGRGHEAEVSTGQIDEIESQRARKYPVRLVRHLVLGIALASWHELPGMRSEGVEIELNSR